MPTDDQASGSNTAPASASSASSTPQHSVVLTHPRDPGTFSGKSNENVDQWLGLYERVAAHNRWDPTMMLPNLLFYLQGSARIWFDTHEEELTSWDLCKQKLRDLFGPPAGSKSAAVKDLSCRAQTATESYVAYILDVLALCRLVDSTMTEIDKVGHILKGIADDAFNLLVFRDCSTVDEIINECRRFEHAKSRRITQQFTRLPNTAATSSCEDAHQALQPSTPDSVVRIVRREIEAAAPSLVRPSENAEATVSLIKAVVREELANAGIQPVCSITRPPVTPADSLRRPSPTFRRYRDPAQWRTHDDRPICFHCSGVGHISRYCPHRQSTFSRSTFFYRRNDSRRPPFSAAPNDSTYCDSMYRDQSYGDSYRSPPASFRRSSRSPSPNDRRSRSPLPRRPSSPRPSGRSSQEN